MRAPYIIDPAEERREREDRVPVGDTRPARFLGLPLPLALLLGVVGYFIALNGGGWRGFAWAIAVVGPSWGIGMLATASDPYGIEVAMAWLRAAMPIRDRKTWGGPALSPLPVRPVHSPRKPTHGN